MWVSDPKTKPAGIGDHDKVILTSVTHPNNMTLHDMSIMYIIFFASGILEKEQNCEKP